ncbi:CvpA family protein [Thermoflexus hugenholtzii]|uniref:Colicin V production protein n=1 Tax=Thermoflexus hugenholtzii JAD2 TaxID=877466 RepID=A0A212PYU3_9CHLR|nr:CvpA family protein [Thermoflexus hugenholtzii]SNB52128.1 Colicin V production protein [Thermoflexus hugenholtzii JAD2]
MTFDAVLVLGALASGYIGGSRGLIKQALSLVFVYFSLLFALSLQDTLVGAFTRAVGVITIETAIFFYIVLFLVSYILLEIVSFISYRATRILFLGFLDPALGGLLGIIWWLVFVGAVLTMIFYSLTVPWTWRLAPIAAALRADFEASITLPTLAMLFKTYAIAPLRLVMNPLPAILTGWP